jgi:phage baseplate assembly protein W
MATTTTIEKYGVPLPLEVVKTVTSKKKKILGLSYPLALNYSTTIAGGVVNAPSRQGNYIDHSSGKLLIRNNLRQLLLTQKGERVMLPEFGLDMNKFLFEPLDETLFYLIRREVVLNVTRYFPLAKIISIAIVSSDLEADRSILRIDLTLQILDDTLEIFDIEVAVN